MLKITTAVNVQLRQLTGLNYT